MPGKAQTVATRQAVLILRELDLAMNRLFTSLTPVEARAHRQRRGRPVRSILRLLILASVWLLVAQPNAASALETIRIGGTGSLLAAMAQIRQAYVKANPDVEIEILPSLGSAGAIRGVGTGRIDLGLTGRPLTEAEATAEAIQELRLQLYALTPFVLVSSLPAPPTLAVDEVAAYLSGARATWPDRTPVRPILRPRTDHDVVLLTRFFPGTESALETLRRRVDVPTAPSDKESLALAQRIPGSLTFATLSQVMSDQPSLSVISIDHTAPSLDTLSDGSYPFVKPIYLVIRAKPSPAAERFLAHLWTAEVEALLARQGAAVVRQ